MRTSTGSSDQQVLSVSRLYSRLDLFRPHGRRDRRQLQHGHVLAFAQPRDQHELPVGELQRVMMRIGVVEVDRRKRATRCPALRVGKWVTSS